MIHSEFNECVKLHQWLKWRDIKHFHCPNETGGNWQRGALNKKIGVSAGVPDYLLFLTADQTSKGLPVNIAIEMKEPSGKNKASTLQKEWLKTLSAQGFLVRVCFGFEDAKDFIINGCGYVDDGIMSAKEYSNMPF